ncbi:symmetrical bis(5'-nucleosyl)-tetraphosphatase [Candidatus Methylocalor cossyra]|uniref:Bis(5'-nucleosyl)-tetraphosphatase, symmetrical n=1 Tax=Candidatus Methylocalor cossyra TaxID=3108543 RepID=A0ABM9NG36_9GAMM
MALYAIGDVQGCFAELTALLEKLRFDPAADRLWFTGDLVNRGPNSLETLRLVRALGAVTVLGNHDLHLLAVAYGVAKTKHLDTFGDVLGAPDREELLDWLRRQPLLHHEHGFYLIHAGLPPQWRAEDAQGYAAEAEALLAGERVREFLGQLRGDRPELWSESLQGWERLRFIVNCLTRLRYCQRDGRVEFQHKGAPGSQPPQLVPWFEAPGRRSRAARIVFGHWSTLGFYSGHGVHCLDTGCLWGGELTALRLDDGSYRRISVPSQRRAAVAPDPAG